MTPRTAPDKGCGCPDERRATLSRRALLRNAGIVGAAGLAAPMLSTQMAPAGGCWTRNSSPSCPGAMRGMAARRSNAMGIMPAIRFMTGAIP